MGCGSEGAGGTTSDPPPTHTPSTLQPADPELRAILTQPGLTEFLGHLESAVETNDVQFFLDNTDYAQVNCDTVVPEVDGPLECVGAAPGEIVPSVPWRMWESEGGYLSERNYERFVMNTVGLPAGDAASMYAAGRMVAGDGAPPEALDVVISGVVNPGIESTGAAGEEAAISLAISSTADGWKITKVDTAMVDLVPRYYEWWIPWDQIAVG